MEESKQKKRWIIRGLEGIGVHLYLHPKFYIILVAVGVGILALSTGLYFYSMSPSFCLSCHIMKPYYDSWKASKHGSVTCVDCHYPPQTREALWAKVQAVNSLVQYATHKYSSRPYAQIEDASCLRSNCHSTSLLKGKITFKKGIRFDHKIHLGDLGQGMKLRCTSCHGQVVVGTHMEVTESTCYACHLKAAPKTGSPSLANCTTCHEIPQKDFEFKGFAFRHRDYVGVRQVPCEKCHRDVIQGEGRASGERCYRCHNQPEHLGKLSEVTLLHEKHVAKRKVDCIQCHEEVKHGLKAAKARFMEYNCEVCHSAVHNGPKEMFIGEGGRGAPPTPSHMYMVRLDCLACHILPKGAEQESGKDGRTLVAAEKSCVDCHGNQYQGMLKDWKDAFDVMLRDIRPKLLAAQQALKQTNVAKDKFKNASKLLEDAKFNINFVRIGKGVHNPFYASELIQVADRNLDHLFRLLGQSPPELPAQSPIRGGYCAQLCHTQAGVKFPKETAWEGAKLPHARHAYDYGVSCTLCHSPERHKELRISKKDCQACHHGPENTKCSSCHQQAAALMEAQNLPLELPEAKPNVKAGKVECIGCHNISKKQTLENLSEACTQCHDTAYKDLAKGWRDEILEAEKKTKDLYQKAEQDLIRARKAKKEIAEATRFLERSKRSYHFVVKARGIHNPDLANVILEQAQKDAQKAEELLTSPRPSSRK